MLDSLRGEYQQIQRSQFEAEKKVAVADTSVQNLQRVIHQIEEERIQREEQRQHLDEERQLKEKELGIKKVDLEQLQQHPINKIRSPSLFNIPFQRYIIYFSLDINNRGNTGV